MGGVDGDARSFQILDGGELSEVLTSKLGLAVDPIPCMHLGSGSPISSTSTLTLEPIAPTKSMYFTQCPS